jgi:hypothetical protein
MKFDCCLLCQSSLTSVSPYELDGSGYNIERQEYLNNNTNSYSCAGCWNFSVTYWKESEDLMHFTFTIDDYTIAGSSDLVEGGTTSIYKKIDEEYYVIDKIKGFHYLGIDVNNYLVQANVY